MEALIDALALTERPSTLSRLWGVPIRVPISPQRKRPTGGEARTNGLDRRQDSQAPLPPLHLLLEPPYNVVFLQPNSLGFQSFRKLKRQ